MPDEDDALEERMRELAVWCHGFLAGLGWAGLDIESDIASEQLKEIIEDFLEISRADPAPEADARGAEFDFAELIEYVRVSVQLAFEELAARRSGSRRTVH